MKAKEGDSMRLEQFEYFTTIAYLKSMNLASEKLHVSQQTLSTSMKKLEEELNVQLLVRSHFGVSLTDEGIEFFKIAEQIQKNIADFKMRYAKKEADIKGRLNIYATPAVCASILPKLITIFNKQHPNIEIRIIEKISSEILIDGNTGQILYENNSDKPIHIGSLNKLMTILLVAECIESGELSLNDELTAGNNAFNETGAVIWLETGEKMSVSDLLKGIIIGNANDACIVFAEKISGSEKDFVKLMNQKAKELGMKNTIFTDCKGTGEGKQYSTAF